MLTNRMVNTLLFETKLPFASSCGSTWPHCNTIYCRWGRYIPRTSLAKMLHIYGDRQLDRVPTHSRKLREMAFPWKIREISGIYQAPQGMFENNKISGNSHRPEVRKLLLFTFSFSRPEVGKSFRIYVFTFSRPEVGKLFHISMA